MVDTDGSPALSSVVLANPQWLYECTFSSESTQLPSCSHWKTLMWPSVLMQAPRASSLNSKWLLSLFSQPPYWSFYEKSCSEYVIYFSPDYIFNYVSISWRCFAATLLWLLRICLAYCPICFCLPFGPAALIPDLLTLISRDKIPLPFPELKIKDRHISQLTKVPIEPIHKSLAKTDYK